MGLESFPEVAGIISRDVEKYYQISTHTFQYCILVVIEEKFTAF